MPPKGRWVAKCNQVFKPRDGSEWSDAASLAGSAAGHHFEKEVQDKLKGTSRKVSVQLSEAQICELQRLYEKAEKRSEYSVGRAWATINNGYKKPCFTGQEAQVDVVTKEKCNLREQLGKAAAVLLGPEEVPEGAVVECCVLSALLLVKSVQLERFVRMYEAGGQSVPHAVIVLNRKPFELAEGWPDFLSTFTALRRLNCEDKLTLVHWPHAVAVAQYQEALEAAEAAEEKAAAAEEKAAEEAAARQAAEEKAAEDRQAAEREIQRLMAELAQRDRG